MACWGSQASSATVEALEIARLGGDLEGGQRPHLQSLGALPGRPSSPSHTNCLTQTPFSAIRPLPLPELPLLSGSNTILRKILYVFQINAIKSIKVCKRSSFSFSFYLIREIPTAQFFQMKPRPGAHCSEGFHENVLPFNLTH